MAYGIVYSICLRKIYAKELVGLSVDKTIIHQILKIKCTKKINLLICLWAVLECCKQKNLQRL
jgi:hypothetical protein